MDGLVELASDRVGFTQAQEKIGVSTESYRFIQISVLVPRIAELLPGQSAVSIGLPVARVASDIWPSR